MASKNKSHWQFFICPFLCKRMCLSFPGKMRLRRMFFFSFCYLASCSLSMTCRLTWYVNSAYVTIKLLPLYFLPTFVWFNINQFVFLYNNFLHKIKPSKPCYSWSFNWWRCVYVSPLKNKNKNGRGKQPVNNWSINRLGQRRWKGKNKFEAHSNKWYFAYIIQPGT